MASTSATDGLDLVIRNGTVIDGSGAEPYRADVAVRGNRIVQIGEVEGAGGEEIDATGCAVTPGFIDGHTHMDAQVMWDALGTCSCWHGVTTVVMGNCGFSLAPVRSDERHLVVRNLERAEDIPAAAMAAGIEWTWETFPEYLDTVERRDKAINYAAYVGHSALRTWAMGERAMEEVAGPDDLQRMSGQLEAALRAGAIGFTTSRSPAHATPDDRPVASRQATWDEVRHLVGVMGGVGHGIFELTPGPGATGDPDTVTDCYEQIYSLALEHRVPVTFGLFGPREQRLTTAERVAGVNAQGGRMFMQTHSRGVSSVMSLMLRLPFDDLPVWRDVRKLPMADQLKALGDPATRSKLVASATDSDYGRRIGTELRKPRWDVMTVLERPMPPNPTVGEIAAQRGADPTEVMIDLILEHDGELFFVQPIGPEQTEAERLEDMRHPHTVMTFSDSGAHVSQIMDASIQTHLLGYWTREREAFTWPEAVRMLTAVPAGYWGFHDRGLLREGYVADLNVFDPERIGPTMPEVVADLPGGAKRLLQKAAGFHATIVGGQVTFLDGKSTGAMPGALVRAGAR